MNFWDEMTEDEKIDWAELALYEKNMNDSSVTEGEEMDSGIVGTGAVGSSPESLAHTTNELYAKALSGLLQSVRIEVENEFLCVGQYSIYALESGGVQVDESVWSYGSYEEPPMGDVVEVETFDDIHQAVTHVLGLLVSDAMECIREASNYLEPFGEAPEKQPTGSPPNSNPSPKESASPRGEK